MADTVNGIVSLFLMMAVGFALYKAGWIEEKGEALLGAKNFRIKAKEIAPPPRMWSRPAK